MKTDLTDRQKEILDFIVSFRTERGYAPSIRQIAKHFGIASTNGVKRHLDALTKKGHITVDNNISRGIVINRDEEEVVSYTDNFLSLPILGRVAAGVPIEANQYKEGSLVVDPAFIPSGNNCFALKVKGDSMIDAGIFEGDYLIIKQTNEVTNGDVVVAHLDGEVTVKYYSNRGGIVSLIPANKNYRPIVVGVDSQFSIVGTVLGITRWY